MLPFSTFLFDLDGTLVDHFAAIHRAHSYTMRQLGLPEPTLEQVHAAVGGGVELAVSRIAGPERVREAMAIYAPYWERTMLDDVALLPGATELLDYLQAEGATMAVFTNKHGPSSRRICDHLGVTHFFRGIYGAFDTPWLKPQREFTDHVLGELHVSARGALMIGDSPWDVQVGKNSGFPAWCVTTGTHNADELTAAGAERVFPDFIALRASL